MYTVERQDVKEATEFLTPLSLSPHSKAFYRKQRSEGVSRDVVLLVPPGIL